MKFLSRVSALALILMVLASPALGSMSWSICDAKTALYRPDSVVLSPDPPVAGADAKFTISGNIVGPVVSGGHVEYKVLVLGFPIYESSIDLCETTACPLEPGPFTVQLTQNLPPYAPAGNYHLEVNIFGDDGSELSCVKVNFHLVHGVESDAKAASDLGSIAKSKGGERHAIRNLAGAHGVGHRARHLLQNLVEFGSRPEAPEKSSASSGAANLGEEHLQEKVAHNVRHARKRKLLNLRALRKSRVVS